MRLLNIVEWKYAMSVIATKGGSGRGEWAMMGLSQREGEAGGESGLLWVYYPTVVSE